MAIEKIGGIGPVAQQPGAESGKQSFSKSLSEAKGVKDVKGTGQANGARSAVEPRPAQGPEKSGAPQAAEVRSRQRVDATRATGGEFRPHKVTVTREGTAAQVVDRVNAAQQRLDQVLRLAESGKTFTPAELLALQAHVYRASQELDLAGKVVEKATSGVKQVLQTQV